MSCPFCGRDSTCAGTYCCDTCKAELVSSGKMCKCGITGDQINEPGEHHFYNCSLYTGSGPISVIPAIPERKFDGGPDGYGPYTIEQYARLIGRQET